METRGRAAVIDARARAEGVPLESERATAARGVRSTGRLALRLVKGGRKSSLGTA